MRRRADPRTVVVSANTSWNIVNFRSGLLKGLAGAGYRPVVVAPPDRYSPILVERGFEFHPLAMDRSGMNPAADVLLLLRYLRLLRRIGAGAYISFTIKPNIYGAIAARLAGVAAINNVSGLGTTFLQQRRLRPLVLRLYRLAFAWSHTVFFQNPDDRRLFLDERVVSPRQARLLPGSGIDLDRFRPDEGGGGEGVTFLFVGRLLSDKGIRDYVEAARLVRQWLPDVRCQVLGELDSGNRTAVTAAELQSWIDSGSIDYLGHSDDVRPFIRRATAVVLPSYREGMPRTLLEGAAMARPLVATDVPGCRELVEEGVTGTLCRARDPLSLARALERIARMADADRRALGAAARRKVQQEFSEEVVVGAYLRVLEEARSTL